MKAYIIENPGRKTLLSNIQVRFLVKKLEDEYHRDCSSSWLGSLFMAMLRYFPDIRSLCKKVPTVAHPTQHSACYLLMFASYKVKSLKQLQSLKVNETSIYVLESLFDHT